MNNQNQQQNQPIKRPRPKWLIAVVAIIVIVEIGLIAWAGYLLFKPPLPEPVEEDEPANWNTYRSEEYGFEIKHPKSWYTYEDIRFGHRIVSTFPQDKYREYFGTEDHKKLGKNSGFILLNLIKTGKSVEETFEFIKNRLEKIKSGEDGFKIEEFITEEINIGDMKGYRIYYPYYENAALYEEGVHIIYLFPDKYSEEGFLFEGDFGGKDKEIYKKYAEKFDKMIFTFKLIECEDQPKLIGLGFKDNKVANKIFIEENNKLRPLTGEEWQQQGYKWNCVKQYYIEEEIPGEVLDKLSKSELLERIVSNMQYWKTYSNKDLGIEFKYPSEWQIEEFLSPETAEKHIESRVPYKRYSLILGPLSIWIDSSIAGANWGTIDDIKTIVMKTEKTLLISRGSSPPNNNIYYTIKLSDGSHNFYLKYTPSQQGSLEWTEAYHQLIFATILSTFKFFE